MMSTLLLYAWVPLITALIGWLTNWLAIRMLFRPRQLKQIFGVRVHGLIPRRKAELAGRTAEVVERELVSQHFIRQQIERIDLESHLDVFVHNWFEKRLGQHLQKLGMVGAFLNERTLKQIEKTARAALLEEVGPLKQRLGAELEGHLNLREHVEKRIAAFEADKLEAIAMRIARKEFRAIELLGGVLGFIVGLAQLGLLYATGGLQPGS
ncbi:MAG: DUF445 domain-containing protein [Opitutales bacterium]